MRVRCASVVRTRHGRGRGWSGCGCECGCVSVGVGGVWMLVWVRRRAERGL